MMGNKSIGQVQNRSCTTMKEGLHLDSRRKSIVSPTQYILTLSG